MAEQDFSEIAKLSERFNKDPKSRMFVQLADAYRKNNMIDEALQVLNQGLQYHPEYPLAHLILGKCYFDKRMFGQAKEALEKTIRFDAQNIVALRMLAQICENLKDEPCQLMAYKGISAIDPFDSMAKDKLVALEARQKKGPVFTLTLAEEYERQANFTEALKVYENLSFTDPTDLVIQQRVKELKKKLSAPVVGSEPPVVETAPAKPEPKIELASMAEIMQELHVAPEVPVIEPVVGKEPEKIEKISGLEPLVEKPSAPVVTEPLSSPVTETVAAKPEEPPQKEVTTVTDFLLEHPKKAEEPPAEKEPPKEEPQEILTIEAFLMDQPKAEETVKEVSAVIPEKEPEKIESIEGMLVSEPPAEDIVGSPKKEPVTSPTSVVEVAKKEPEMNPVVEEKQPEVKVEAPTEENIEEAKKPKEEDFKSFQDWLSGLLK